MQLHRMMLDESSITISSERFVRVFSGKLPRYFITKHVMPLCTVWEIAVIAGFRVFLAMPETPIEIRDSFSTFLRAIAARHVLGRLLDSSLIWWLDPPLALSLFFQRLLKQRHESLEKLKYRSAFHFSAERSTSFAPFLASQAQTQEQGQALLLPVPSSSHSDLISNPHCSPQRRQ
jgi:hypothetical protein